MSRHHVAILVLLLLAGSIFPVPPASGRGSAPAEGRKTVGVALLPRVHGFSDGSEETLYRLMGEIDFVDHVHPVASPLDLLRLLNKYAKGERRIDPLIIGGHGPKPGNDNPGILLGSMRLESRHLDLPYLTETLATNERDLRELEQAERANRDAGLGSRINALRMQISDLRTYLVELQVVWKAMAPGATIWLYNCNALQGPNGVQFAGLLGRALLGRQGGQVMGSTINVGLGNDVTRFVADMRDRNWTVTAKWRRVPTEPIFFFGVESDHPWHRLTNEQWRQKQVWFSMRSASGETLVYRAPGAYGIARTGVRLHYFDHPLFLHYHRLIDSGPVPDDPKILGFEIWESIRDGGKWTFWLESR